MRVDVTNLTEIQKRALRREFLKRKRTEAQAVNSLDPSPRELELAIKLDNELFDKQKQFLNSESNRLVGFCTRRAGKTEGLIKEMSRVLLRNPTSLQIYFAQTALAAKTWVWGKLKTLIRRLELPFTWNEQDLWIIHKRGDGKIILRGAEDDDELDKHRGPAYIRVYIDEAGHFRKNLKKLLTEVVGAALRDNPASKAIMTGTAGNVREGYFYEATQGLIRRRSDGKPVWELHEWSLQDNPHLPARAKDDDAIIDDDGFSGPDDPRFLREYKRIWAVDTDKRMFAFCPVRNVYAGQLGTASHGLPEGHEWQSLLGVDFGWNDQTAIAMIWYSLTYPNCFIPETWAAKNQFTDDIAERILNFRLRYGVTRYVGDVGGYGKSPQVHLARDYGIHIHAAKKREKLDHLAFFNSALKRGELLIKTGDDLCTQFPRVEWNNTRTGAANHARDDRCFAALYAWREAKSSGAGTQVRDSKEKQTDSIREAAIQEKLDVLNAPTDRTEYAHKKPLLRRNRQAYRGGFSALHQLVGRRRT